MRYAVLNLDYKIENIIESDKTFADTIMAIPIDGADAQIGDTYNISKLWFESVEGIQRTLNDEIFEIDKNVVENIRTQYSTTDELKLIRTAVLDPTNAEFLTYNTFVEQCRNAGKGLKQKLLESYYQHLLAIELEVTQ